MKTLVKTQRWRWIFAVAIGLAAMFGLARWTPAQAQTEKPYVILVSIDGFRYDFAARYRTKNIQAVGEEGAAAESMIPSFPTVTFPNHISIVTGLYPEHHGIVANTFFDTVRGARYTMRTGATDGTWFDARATPLWVLAEQQHVISACMFWPMAESEVRGVRPTYWKLYDGSFANEKRVEQVIDWLKLPADKRPHLITLYFSDVDSAGHRFGPETAETAAAARVVDGMIGRLRAGLAELKLPVNLILVSDHGMQDVKNGEVSLTRDVDKADARVELNGPVALIYGRDAAAIEKTYAKLKQNSKLEVYRRAETPAGWHYRDNPRSGDLVAMVKGTAVFTINDGNDPAKRGPPKGEHGYDPAKYKTMHAIFYASGPNVKAKTKIRAFENVNVYPFIAKILGLKTPEKLDGSAAVLDPIYQR